MDEIKTVSNNYLSVNPEELQNLINTLKKSMVDLKNAKNKADDAWSRCEASLGATLTQTINERKTKINESFNKAIDEIDNSTNVLTSVTNIWKDTENEILKSSRTIDDYVLDIAKKISSTFNNINK